MKKFVIGSLAVLGASCLVYSIFLCLLAREKEQYGGGLINPWSEESEF